jgi:hypothetical protein
MFGDILSDAAAALVGSIGLIPSASFGSTAPLFEPIHGSAPSLVGTDAANPIGSILSATMMLRDAFGLALEADWVEQSLLRVLAGGYHGARRSRRGRLGFHRNPPRRDAAHARTCRALWLGRVGLSRPLGLRASTVLFATPLKPFVPPRLARTC